MRNFKVALAASLAFFLSACEIAPKGELTRTEIDRPYTLPDDVAKISGAVSSQSTRLENPDDSYNHTSESTTNTTPGILFENSINDDFGWIFPLGFRWRIFHDERNSFGISAFTLILFNALSVDYWFRISDQFSLRPYYRAASMDWIFVQERRNYFGAELLYQATDHWAFSGYGHGGRYSVKSELVDIIVRGFSNNDDFTSEVSGDFWGAGLSTVYSADERWDITGRAEVDRYDLGFGLLETTLQAGVNYYW